MAHLSARVVVVAVSVAFGAACGLAVVGSGVVADGVDSGSSPRPEASLPESGPSPEAGVDGAPDAARDADADALVDAGCPAACTGGCVGATCVIADPSGNVTCPSGRPCRVQCSNCDSTTITCADGPCTVVCTGNDACNSVTIDALGAASFCLDCSGGPGCNGLTCNDLPACTKRCATCNSIGSCDTCSDVASCP